MAHPLLRLVVFYLTATGLLATGSYQRLSSRSLDTADAPRVRLIATGGTIAARPGGSRLTAQELVESVPGLPRYVRAEWEQFSNVPSTALAVDQWLQLARRLNELFAGDRSLAGIVVATGTDTLEELAYFLNLTVRTSRPVVVVGSMRMAGAPGSDGPANLLSAFRTAADESSADKGVLVVMNDEINSARDVVKTDAQRLDTFQSRHYGVLGVVDPDRVVFNRQPVKRHTVRSEFDVRDVSELPRVDIVLFYQGATPDLVRAAIDFGAKGLVIAVAGADTTAGSLGTGLTYAARQRVPVVLSTRTGEGRIASPSGDAVLLDYIAGEDLSPLKARILLTLALTRTRAPTEIQRMFREY